VIGAVFCLGCAGLSTWRDRRWSSLSLLLDVAVVMIVAILAGAVRSLDEFNPTHIMTWLLAAGFIAVLVGALRLRRLMRNQLPVDSRRG
jgi:hypothetical protein